MLLSNNHNTNTSLTPHPITNFAYFLLLVDISSLGPIIIQAVFNIPYRWAVILWYGSSRKSEGIMPKYGNYNGDSVNKSIRTPPPPNCY